MLNWEAQVDAFYQWNFTGASSNTQGPLLRVFDTTANSFTLNMAKVATYMTADPVGFRIDVIYGNVGAVGNGFSGAASGGGTMIGTATLPNAQYFGGVYVEQAYATMKGGIFTLDVGRFVTNASDEVIETKANFNYSRSLLFNGVPFQHTGARLGVAVSDMLALQLGIVNGINNDPDNNNHKTFSGQVALTLPSKTTAFLNTYIGKEGGTTGTETSMLFDVVLGQSLSDTMGLSLNFDYNKVGSANWWGVGLKAKLGLSDMFYLAPRVEFLKSKGLYAGYTGQIYEGTLTAGVPVAKNYEFRAEFRADFTDKDTIFDKGGVDRKNQITGLLGFLAWLP